MSFAQRVPGGDARLIQITDRILEDATARAGEWLKCRPGCTQCCHGTFAINLLDAARLRGGFERLKLSDADAAEAIAGRAEDFVNRHRDDFPGDARTGLLGTSPRQQQQFEAFANDDPCPVLDPDTGLCGLYSDRPMTCRVFGPPVRSGEDGSLGVCELCFVGADPRIVAACEMKVDPEGLEPALNAQVEVASDIRGETIIAYALLL